MRLWLSLIFIVALAHGALAAEADNFCVNGSPPPQFTPCTPTNPLPVEVVPAATGQTAILGNATGTTGAVIGTLAGATGKTTYICGFSVSAIGGTAAVGPITIAGPSTSLVYELASSASGNFLTQGFAPCIPASTTNTAITVTTTADGTASAVAVNSWGFQQ